MTAGTLVSVFVPGHPKTKGSLDFILGRKCKCCAKCEGYLGRGHVKENVMGSKAWRGAMAKVIGDHLALANPYGPASGAVSVCAIFFLPVKDVTKARTGDLDKLLRNLLDALQDAKAYVDDTQVVRVVADKTEAGDMPQGLLLSVREGRV